MQSDIRVPLDTSISRKHAKIIVDEPDLFAVGDGQQRPKVSIKDLGSTYGTYVGDEAVASSANCSQDDRIVTEVALTDGIRIRFGLHTTIFR
jgi:pSer/pThr/pTyr-binding forkhead associated (FHA) protein